MLDVLFLKVLFYCLNNSGTLVLTHNIPRMIISEKESSKGNMMFLECTVAITCLCW
jgi:hypothetical protein